MSTVCILREYIWYNWCPPYCNLLNNIPLEHASFTNEVNLNTIWGRLNKASTLPHLKKVLISKMISSKVSLLFYYTRLLVRLCLSGPGKAYCNYMCISVCHKVSVTSYSAYIEASWLIHSFHHIYNRQTSTLLVREIPYFVHTLQLKDASKYMF